MKKCFFLFLYLLFLTSCAPSTQTQEVTINLSEIEALPDDLEGSILCTVTYTPGEELFVSVQNDTEFTLYSFSGDGLLYRQETDNWWRRVDMLGPVAGGDIAVYTDPGTINETDFFAAGLYAPELGSGEYKLVFSVSLLGDKEEDSWKFKLEIPFSVS